MMAQFQPSGVRLAFTTDASWIQLDTVRSRVAYAGAPARPDGVIEFTVTGEVLGSAVTSGGRTTTIEMWLPHNEVTELVALRTNAPVSATPDRGGRYGCTTAVPSAKVPMPHVRRRFGRLSLAASDESN